MAEVRRVAIDTNVFVYALSGEDPAKQDRALTLIARLKRQGNVVAAQVLGESARILTVKRRPPLPPSIVSEWIRKTAVDFQVMPLTPEVVLEALRGVEQYRFSYYDAQIWAAARLAGAAVLLSEDFQPGRTVEGVTFVNPFAPGFDVGTL